MRSSAKSKQITRHGATRPTPATLRARCGSALVVVIGTLALISVFAAIYISIGRSDTRAVATQEFRAEQGDYADRYLEWGIGVIGDDRLDATMQYADEALRYQIPRRETTDAPYTDWSVRSQSNDPADWFFPAGGNPYTRQSGDNFDPRVPSDPWLASIRPEFLGDPDTPEFSNLTGGTGLTLDGFLNNRDWLQITNMAPDGRFVNLFNLRPQEFPDEPGSIGGFNAEPGWGSTDFGTRPNIRRMSQGLSLYRPLNTGDPESPIQSFDPTQDGFWLPGLSGVVGPQTLGLGASDIENIPAVWSMYQRFALIPLDQPFVTYNRQGNVSTWADPDFPAYQWADADGDGFADSRWFELTLARNELSGRNPRDDVQRLYDAGEFRVFAAARVVDLSGMVNANVARDSLGAPTARYPLGLTPVEVDLRRLLTMQDQAEQYDGDLNGALRVEPLSYAHLRRPPIENGIGRNADLLPDADYSRYRHAFESPNDLFFELDPGQIGFNNFPGSSSPTQPEFPNAMLIGRYAASAIHESVARGVTLPPNARGPLPFDSSAALPGDLAGTNLLLTEGSPVWEFGQPTRTFEELAQDRLNFFIGVGRFDPTRQDERQTSSLFGIDDLAELLTFHGLNDPEVTSRLESAAQGRFQYLGGTGDERFSPLLSTRPLSLDRDLHGQIPVLASNPNRGTEITGEISRESMALITLSPRTKLSTITGAVPMPPMGIAGPAGRNGAQITPVGLLDESNRAYALRDLDPQPGSNNTTPTAGEMWGVFSGALAGELEVLRFKRASGQDGLPAGIVNAVWDADLSQVRQNPYSTLFYGHRGPELALRIAAHAAVNAKDLFDADSNTTVATLVLDNDQASVRTPLIQFQRYVDNTPSFDLSSARGSLALLYPGLSTSSNLFDMDRGLDAPQDRSRRVLPDGVLPDGRKLVNVYGVEATPIITEVAALYVYTDAPQSAGGDADFRTFPGGRVPINLDESDTTQITISPTLDVGNTDLLMSVLAFQITNPWDVPISLGGGDGPGGAMWRVAGDDATDRFDDASNLQFNYYIEYNGYFFKLGEFREYLEPLSNGGPDYTANSDFVAASGLTIDPNGQPIPIVPGGGDSGYEELEYRNATIPAGGSRVFFVTSHTRFDSQASWGGLEQRWRSVVAGGNDFDDQYTSVTIDTLNDNDTDLDTLPDGFDDKGWTGPVYEWLLGQFSPRGSRQSSAVRIHPFNPRTGELILGEGTQDLPAEFVDFVGTPGDPAGDLGMTGRDPAPGVVRLWKKFAVNGAEEVSASQARGAQIENYVQNDILVDRIYTDASNTQNYLAGAAWSDSDSRIADSVGWAEGQGVLADPCNIGTPTINARNDNTGLTFARYASVRRRDTADQLAPSEVNPQQNVGKIDAYMMASGRDRLGLVERYDNSTFVPSNPSITNFYDLCDMTSPGNPYNGVDTDDSELLTNFVRYDAERFVFDFWAKGLFNVVGPRVASVATISRHPRLKNSGVDLDQSVEDPLENRFRPAPLNVPAGRLGLFDSPGTPTLRPEIFVSEPESVGRVADMLRVMGIGPAYAPDPSRDPVADYAVVDEEWMTLSEAFAIALGFEDFTTTPPNFATDVSPDLVWWDSVKPYTDPETGASEVEYVLDDLRLRLDDYVAFLNIDAPGEIEKAFFDFDPVAPVGSDVRRGTGVPMALGVLDGVRAFGPALYPGSPSDELERALTTPTMGLVNINTAPLDVLRLLPGLSPSSQGVRQRDAETGSAIPQAEWWAARSGRTTLNDGAAVLGESGDPLGLGADHMSWNLLGSASPTELAKQNPDIAAGLAAYRDRLFANPRARSNPRFIPALATSFDAFGFAPDMTNTPNARREELLANRYGEQPVGIIGELRTRATVSGVDGLRGTPGFGSLGEMLMATVRDDAAAIGAAGTWLTEYPQLDIQQLAGDGLNLGVSDTTDGVVSLSPNFISSNAVSNDNRAGSTPDDYVEKLAAAAGVMNMTTTRSDFFAVWMVIQGFRESDVATLRPSDPLVPSFKRRFLMVLDRSNVLEPGDSPRVVLMREVPL